jgi:F0F1-type ATP synthase epsilon subunit
MIAHIISAEQKRSFEIIWTEINTVSGNMVILESHAPIIATLVADKPIVLSLVSGKQELIHLQKQAYFELSDTVITVIL